MSDQWKVVPVCRISGASMIMVGDTVVVSSIGKEPAEEIVKAMNSWHGMVDALTKIHKVVNSDSVLNSSNVHTILTNVSMKAFIALQRVGRTP